MCIWTRRVPTSLVLQALLWLMPITACAQSVNPRLNLQPGTGTWTTGCRLSNGETLAVAMRGLERLRVATPCPQLEVSSHYRGTGIGALPENAAFHEILVGRTGNWSWRILGAKRVISAWSKQTASTPPEYDGRSHGPVVDWRGMFATLHSVYAYVLNGAPPASEFALNFFPSTMSVNRKELTSTQISLNRPFYLPFDVSPPTQKGAKPQLNPLQQAYVQAFQVICAEYMHELYFTKHLKPMNMLSHSVADAVTCTGAELLVFRSDPNFSMTFPAANSLNVAAAKKVARKNNDVDHWAFLLGTKNISHLLGADKQPVRVRATDTTTILKILRLARAMLEDPVDLSYQSYPLKRIDLQPPYAGTIMAPTPGS